MKHNFYFSLMAIVSYCFVLNFANAQSCISNQNFLNDRETYLSQLDETKIKSKYLIDRVEFNNILLNVDGTNKITTITSTDFFKLAEDVVYSSSDTANFSTFDSFIKNNGNYYKSTNNYPLGLIDYTVKKIKCESLIDGSFTEGQNYLIDQNATESSYENIHVVALSPLSSYIVGNKVTYYFGDMFKLSNNSEEELANLQIDFGNGEGFKQVNNNTQIEVAYGKYSNFIKISAKITLRNKNTKLETTYLSNSTIYRENIQSQVQARTDGIDVNHQSILSPTIRNFYTSTNTNTKLQYHILFSDNNLNIPKLNKPIIVCDGFDPGNNRTYNSTYYEKAPELEYDKDNRGLFQLINGDSSPWYSTPSADLIYKLLSSGYDIIIVDYIEGADDVTKNALLFKDFLKNVVNNAIHRDRNTEEAILIGPSMGGLITRIALTQMEKENENHYIKQWISFDSPQGGAYIPISMQHTLNFMSNIHTGKIKKLIAAKKTFVDNLAKLNATAAKQMLNYHYSRTWEQANAALENNTLYENLRTLGYPLVTENISITNGGLGTLYSNEGSINNQVVALNIFSWCYARGDRNHTDNVGNYFIFEGSRQGFGNDEYKMTKNQIPYESAPGGWNSSIYTINFDEKNKWKETNINQNSKVKSCFIPTISAFGIMPTNQNIETTWNNVVAKGVLNPLNKPVSPFDAIYGMSQNEEHVRISGSTANYIIDKFKSFNLNVSKPYHNDRFNLQQQVTGAVKYRANHRYSFCELNNNKFTIKNGSDIIVEAGSSISFSPGFTIETGAKFETNINPTLLLNPQRVENNFVSNWIDKQNSPYAHELVSSIQIQNKNEFLTFSPNPIKDKTIINCSFSSYILEIYDLIGNKVLTLEDCNNGSEINLTSLKSGIYIIKAIHENETLVNKIIKE